MQEGGGREGRWEGGGAGGGNEGGKRDRRGKEEVLRDGWLKEPWERSYLPMLSTVLIELLTSSLQQPQPT